MIYPAVKGLMIKYFKRRTLEYKDIETCDLLTWDIQWKYKLFVSEKDSFAKEYFYDILYTINSSPC